MDIALKLTFDGLTQVLNGLPIAVAVVDKNRIIKLVNDVTYKLVNRKSDVLIGYTSGKAFECIHRNDSPRGCGFGLDCLKCRLKEIVNKTIQEKRSFQKVETTMILQNRGETFLRITSQPLIVDNEDVVLLSIEDVTDYKKQEQVLLANEKRLKESEEHLSDAQAIAHLGHWEWNLQTNELFWSDEIYRIFGLEPQEFGATYDAFMAYVHREDRSKVIDSVQQTIENKAIYNIKHRVVRPDGEVRWVQEQGKVSRDESSAPLRMLGTVHDITEMRELENSLRELATTDPLTGAYNRRYFMERFEGEFHRSRRFGLSLVIVSIDIDHFKSINDTFGHPAGDKVLQNLVTLCQRILRKSDLFGRIGGEEFMIMLPQTNLNGGLELTERIRETVEKEAVPEDDRVINYTFSAGITVLHSEDQNINNLLKRADHALYEAKNKGRNRIESG